MLERGVGTSCFTRGPAGRRVQARNALAAAQHPSGLCAAPAAVAPPRRSIAHPRAPPLRNRPQSAHDWLECPYAHRGEKAARRDPNTHNHVGVICPDIRRVRGRLGWAWLGWARGGGGGPSGREAGLAGRGGAVPPSRQPGARSLSVTAAALPDRLAARSGGGTGSCCSANVAALGHNLGHWSKRAAATADAWRAQRPGVISDWPQSEAP